MSSGNWGPPIAVTKDEHDAKVAKTGRPYTQDPMRAAERVDDGTDGGRSVVDEWIKNTKGNR